MPILEVKKLEKLLRLNSINLNQHSKSQIDQENQQSFNETSQNMMVDNEIEYVDDL
jgi:hypothetical protein